MGEQREQVLTFREVPIVIDTAHGLIEIHRVPNDRSSRAGRKIRLLLPDGLRAHIGKHQIESRSPWVILDGEQVKPKHKLLEAVSRGLRFILRPPPPLRIARDDTKS